MPEHRVPQWHPIEALPMIGQAIDGMLESAEDVVQSLEQARPRPHVLDDYTIGRVREAHGTQLNDLWWYTEQLARWRQARPTPAQAQELERLMQQLTALRRALTASLALAEELQAGTIEKVLAKDDVEGIGKSNGHFHRPQHGVSPHAPHQRLASPVGSRQATGPRRRARTGRVAGDGQPALLGLLGGTALRG